MNRLKLSALKPVVTKVIAIAFSLHLGIVFANSNPNHQYQQALAQARSGDTELALKTFDLLVKLYPEKPLYRYDYIQVLSWTNRYQETLKQGELINLSSAPVYVLVSLARAARNLKDFKRAESLYRLAMRKDPEFLDGQIGLALVLIDQNQPDPAIQLLTRLAERYPNNIDIFLGLAYAYENKKLFITAVQTYEHILTIKPGEKEAIRGGIFDLSAAGALNLAYEKAQLNKELFSDEEWARFHWDDAATLIRWGEVTPYEQQYRFIETDRAIKAVEDNMALLKSLDLKKPDEWLAQARIDYMVALRYRYRMQDVLDQYEILKKQGVEIPVYGLSPVADAYLYLEQPENARDLYLAIIKEYPKDFNARHSLVYAYMEAEQYDEAVELIEQMNKEQPEKLWFKPGNGSEYSRGNPKRTQTEQTRAILKAYGDMLEEAQTKLEELYGRASFNEDTRQDLVRVYYFRGWPRLANKQAEMAINMAPGHVGLRTSHALLMRELKYYRQAEKETLKLFDRYPEDKDIQKQKKLWDIHNDWEFKSFNFGGLSTNPTSTTNNNPRGSEDIGLDNYLYSPPIGYNYRIFAHQGWATGLYPRQKTFLTNGGFVDNGDLRAYLRTYGLGLEYSSPDWLATGEIHYDSYGKTGVGITLNAAYDFNDYWQVSAGFDSLDNNISLRALANGIRANTTRLQLTYRLHESRQFDLLASYSAYSSGHEEPLLANPNVALPPVKRKFNYDENERFGIGGTYFERWYSGPRYKFGTYLSAGFSANSSQNVPYFNPSKDASVSLTLDHDYLTYRYYDTSFHQRLGLSVGNYWQNGYGSNITGNIQYEHHWKAADRFELVYGASRGWTAYDGTPTDTWNFYLNTDIRF